MAPSLERIEIAGPGSKARRLVFDDGLDPRLTSAAAVKALGLVPEMDISREAVERSLADIEPALAKDRALRLLGYREHSAAELRRKLQDNGYPRDLAAGDHAALRGRRARGRQPLCFIVDALARIGGLR